MIILLVADQEGITMPEIISKLSLSQGAVSRNVKMLSKWGSKDGVMHEYDILFTQPDPWERRRFGVHLTEKGKGLINRLIEEVGDCDCCC